MAKELLYEVNQITKLQQSDSLKLNDITIITNQLEAKLDLTLIELSEEKNKVEGLSKKVHTLSLENISLKKKLSEIENYSKKNNLKFFGVPEARNENTKDLMDKLAYILSEMNLNLASMCIDNLHRLPGNNNGPKPLIVKFTRYLDRQLVWRNRHMLANTNLKISICEHFAANIEANIRTLLPIRRVALQEKLKVNMSGDKLYINGQLYITETVDRLPPNLRPENLAHREIENHLFFCSNSSPLSNFYPSTFSVDGTEYSHGEQFIQQQKAILFKAREIVQQVLLASRPGEMKKLTSRLDTFYNENQMMKNKFSISLLTKSGWLHYGM